MSYGDGKVKRSQILHPAATIIAYTTFPGHPDFHDTDSPAYMIVGTNDWIVPYHEMEERAACMRSKGIDVELHVLSDTQHGFGVGNGTRAEGWMQQAMDFWERHMK